MYGILKRDFQNFRKWDKIFIPNITSLEHPEYRDLVELNEKKLVKKMQKQDVETITA